MTEGNLKIRRAVISVSNKDGLQPLAEHLVKSGVEIFASGNTKATLESWGVDCQSTESITRNPEAFQGRMKTLSFHLLSALLFKRGDSSDRKQAEDLGVEPIDLVVCNFYPFEANQHREKLDELVEFIDIGGPTMVRAAAKNYSSVGILTDPAQYQPFIQVWNDNEGIPQAHLLNLAVEAFELTASYEKSISTELRSRLSPQAAATLSVQSFMSTSDPIPLRYGENPQQRGFFTPRVGDTFQWKVIGGKELSYNNLLDVDAAIKAVSLRAPDLGKIAGSRAAVIKHLSPCGLAWQEDPMPALELAWSGDTQSAFGGVVAVDFHVDENIAKFFKGKFIEVLCARGFQSEVIDRFRAEKPNLRLVEYKGEIWSGPAVRSALNGVLVQDQDCELATDHQLVTVASFSNGMEDGLPFAESSCQLLKSNAVSITFQHPNGGWMLIGTGQGQPNRVDCIEKLAIPRALNTLVELFGSQSQASDYLSQRCVLASDAFFPFPDSIEVAHRGGIRFILQPGGSKKDPEVIEKCNELDVAMVFTGKRHFSH